MRTLRAVAVAVVVSGGFAFAGEKQAGAAPASSELHAQMTASAQKMQRMKMSGDFDHDFVKSLRQHHRDGIEMAKLALKHARDPQAREFAQKVVDQQTRELKELDAWLAQHAHGGSGTHHPE